MSIHTAENPDERMADCLKPVARNVTTFGLNEQWNPEKATKIQRKL